jgi:hypothetical protein
MEKMEKKKTALFFLVAFLLFALDIGCTYVTFAIKRIPVGYEVNWVFRDWLVRDGWLLSVGKFVLLKTGLFGVCGWLIFRTESQLATFIIAQCSVTNHLVAILSHPTLWWMHNMELRALLLCVISLVSLFLTYFGIRYLRMTTLSPVADNPESSGFEESSLPCLLEK